MPRALSQGVLTEGKASPDDIAGLVNLIHADSSQEYRKKRRFVSDGSATPQEIWALDMPGNSVWRVTAEVTGKAVDASGRAAYVLVALFYRTTGASIQQGTTVVQYSEESDVTMDAAVVAASNGVSVRVQDVAGIPANWAALVRIEEI